MLKVQVAPRVSSSACAEGYTAPMSTPHHAADPLVLQAEEDDAGRRLDAFLSEKLGLSRSRVRKLIDRGGVVLNGRPALRAAKGLGLEPGWEIAVSAADALAEPRAAATPDPALAVLAQGPGWLAVDKPPGTPVHPLHPTETGTLLNVLVARHPEIHGVGEGGLRSGVVHRLDVETSGVLLFATGEAAWRRLRAAFRERCVAKRYRALVQGRLEGQGSVELDLRVARHRPARVRVCEPGASGSRRTLTRWRGLEVLGGGGKRPATLIELAPETGFLHQIRVSLAHLGHPVIGDAVYGEPDAPVPAPRHMLHAARLHFEDVLAESPDPPDFRDALERLRAGWPPPG